MSDHAWYSERGFVAAGVFIVAVVFAGGVLALSGGSDGSQARVSGRPTVPAAAHRPVDTGGSVCGLAVGNRDKPVGPPTATWTLVGQIAVPGSAAAGPGIHDGHRRVCFAHSPTGALFAAANFLGLASAYGSDVSLMREILAATKARDILLRQNAEPSDPFFRAEITGFRVAIVSRNLVVVELALRASGGQLGAITLPERWEQRGRDGDWRTVISDIERPYEVTPLTDASDFVFWSGA